MSALGFTSRGAKVNRRLAAGIGPACAIAGAIILSVPIACLRNPAACAVALLPGAVIVALMRPGRLASRFAAVNAFVLFMWLIVPWTTPGAPAFPVGGFAVTWPGVELCVRLTLKANAILLVFLGLVAPLSVSALARGLACLRCPARLAWMLLLMERNVFILKREWCDLLAAAKLRAFVPATSRRAYSAMAAMLALLLIRAIDRGRRLNEAMLLAGYDGSLPFGSEFAPGPGGLLFLLLACSCSAALIWLDYA